MSTLALDREFQALPGFKTFGQRERTLVLRVPDSDYGSWLRMTNGGVAYHGALRFFPAVSTLGLTSITLWNAPDGWELEYDHLAPTNLMLFAEDAFGVQFGFNASGAVVRFWNETGDQEPLDMRLPEFLAAVRADPTGTISEDLYRSAIAELGPLIAR